MLSVLGIVTLVLLLLVALPADAAGAQSPGEVIRGYDVAVEIETDGNVRVTETIAYDFGGERRHGIHRRIPWRLRHDDRYDRVYPLEVLRVTASPGTPAQHEVERHRSERWIKIGDPDRTITGVHTYTIEYRMEAVLNGFEAHDELYWNAIGAEWAVPVERSSVRVSAPATITRVACFAGPTGSQLPCAESTVADRTAVFSHGRLNPYEALTVVVGLPPAAVPPPRPILEERWSITRAFSVTPATVAGFATILAGMVGAFLFLAWRHGRDRRWAGSHVDAVFGNAGDGEHPVPLTERTVVPLELAPPDGMRPGQVGTLVDEHASPLDVTATIVDFAVRGYLRIEEIPKRGWFGKADWRLVRVHDDTTELHDYERLLLTGLFEDSADGTVLLSDLRNAFVRRLRAVQEALYRDVVGQGWFPSSPDHVRRRWQVIGGAVAVVGVGLVWLTAGRTRSALVPVSVVLGGLLFVFGARWMPHRTPKGTAALRRVQGFRRFIEESDRERFRFAERRNLFEEYLPYAVVFGCTEKWARAFAGLAQEPAAPSWYVGSSGAFDLRGFSESLAGFSVATAGTVASSPGGSGFGGGGGAGGGIGGGGGGSW